MTSPKSIHHLGGGGGEGAAETLPAPLTPPDCDLRDFPRMMLDIGRLRSSTFDATLDDSAWRAGLNLWMSAWHQVPAASLANDDASLAKAAGLGRDVRTWRKVKAEALRNWVECNDGQIYHPTVAEIALEAWIDKLGQRLSSGAGNGKRYGNTFDPNPLYEEIKAAAGMLESLNPKSRTLSKQHVQKAIKGIPLELPPGDDNLPPGDPVGSQGKGREGNTREEEASASSLSADKPARPTKGPKRKAETAIPAGFPDETAIAEAQAAVLLAGVTLNVASHVKRFRNHAATKDRRERDWSAAWRGWIEIEIEKAPAAPSASPAIEPTPWPGPPEVRAAVLAAPGGERLARGFLDVCAWQDVPTRAVVTSNGFVADTLRKEVGGILSSFDVRVLVEPQPERKTA